MSAWVLWLSLVVLWVLVLVLGSCAPAHDDESEDAHAIVITGVSLLATTHPEVVHELLLWAEVLNESEAVLSVAHFSDDVAQSLTLVTWTGDHLRQVQAVLEKLQMLLQPVVSTLTAHVLGTWIRQGAADHPHPRN